MMFVYPIEGKNAEDLYNLNKEGIGGFYPIGLYNSYHGGIHIEGNHAVIAIAEGTIVAYRYSRKYLEETLGANTYNYSNSFILIRHNYISPKGRELTFYSHYNHLCPWDDYNASQKSRKPAFFAKPGFCINASTLNVRSSMDLSNDDNKIEASKLKNGDEVIASAVNEKWAKKEAVEEYFFHKGYATPITISSAPEFDSVVACEIPIKAGALLGYTGLYEGEGIEEKYTAVHVEVFAEDEALKFVENTEKEGQNKPTLLKIAAQTKLKKRTKKYSDLTTIKKGALRKDTTVRVLVHDENSSYIKIQELHRTKDVAHASLTNWTDPPGANNGYYNPKSDKLSDIQNTFNDTTITAGTKLFSAGKASAPSNRRIRYDIPTSSAQTVWIKKDSAGSIKEGLTTLRQDIFECYSDNPDTMIFSQDIKPIAKETLVRRFRFCSGLNSTLWIQIKTA